MTIELSEMPTWPIAFTLVEAVAYSGIGASEIRRGIRRGELVFKPLGKHGRKIVPKFQLDAFITALFADRKSAPPEDMDFGPELSIDELPRKSRRRRLRSTA